MAQEIKQKKQKKKKNRIGIKVLFLDVDGVLNTLTNEKLSAIMIKRLALVIEQTQCKICLSTSWRTNQDAKDVLFNELQREGNIKINALYIGDTPAIYHKPRAYEIEQFLKNSEHKIINYVVIDDMDLAKPMGESRKLVIDHCALLMRNHFVQSDVAIGLTNQNVKEIYLCFIENTLEYCTILMYS
eukprot:1042612_1